MFAPPPEIETRVFATVPPELQLHNRPSAWTDKLFRGRTLGSFLEGPSFDREGNLYMVDVAHGRIFRVTPKAEWSVVADYDGEPNGLKIHRDGRIFVADQQNGIIEIDPVNGKVSPILAAEKIVGYNGINDLFFASNGDLYMTDQGQRTGLQNPVGRILCLRADGRVDCIIDDIPSPNGLVMAPDEFTLYIAVTQMNAIWRAPFWMDGSISKVGIFAYMSGGIGPDGMAMDTEGNLVVAHPGIGSVWQFSPHGEPVARLPACAGAGRLNTNMAYGGPENKTLYITESETGTVLTAEMPVAGLPMFSHM